MSTPEADVFSYALPLRNSLYAGDLKARYDEKAKHLLSYKPFLAWILHYCVKEFKDCAINKIPQYIDDVQVSAKSVEAGAGNSRIRGENSENIIPEEGKVMFDIIFRARSPHGQDVQVIINLEIQNDYYPGYDLVTRGLYYCARMLSSQAETDISLAKSEYKKLKKVYSIWLCFNSPEDKTGTISSYKMKPQILAGKEFEDRSYYDLLEVIIIRLSDERQGANELLDMLSVLFSEKMSGKDKADILEKDYQIAMYEKMDKEANFMCNLSDGIENKAEFRLVCNAMNSFNLTLDKAMEALCIPEEKHMLFHRFYQEKLNREKRQEEKVYVQS